MLVKVREQPVGASSLPTKEIPGIALGSSGLVACASLPCVIDSVAFLKHSARMGRRAMGLTKPPISSPAGTGEMQTFGPFFSPGAVVPGLRAKGESAALGESLQSPDGASDGPGFCGIPCPFSVFGFGTCVVGRPFAQAR